MKPELFFGRLQNQYHKKYPFACFTQNGAAKAYLQTNNTLYPMKDFNFSGYIFCPYNLKETKIILPEDKSEVLHTELKTSIFKKSPVKKFSIKEDKQKHLDLVSKAIETIKQKRIEKIVCSRSIKVAISVDPIEVFERLSAQYPDAYVYCWYHPDIGLWIGATPERFLHLDRNLLTTMSLAGTIDAQKYPTPVWTHKEKNEQKMVTDFIVNALKIYTNTIEVEELKTVKAAHLWHLKTIVKARITPDQLSSIIEQLHPTSAVCGLPKQLAKEFLAVQEGYNRKYYTGFLGELQIQKTIARKGSAKNQEQLAIKEIKKITDLYVNLRCMQVYKNHIEIFVGGGITKDSSPMVEYEETVSKSQTLLNVL